MNVSDPTGCNTCHLEPGRGSSHWDLAAGSLRLDDGSCPATRIRRRVPVGLTMLSFMRITSAPLTPPARAYLTFGTARALFTAPGPAGLGAFTFRRLSRNSALPSSRVSAATFHRGTLARAHPQERPRRRIRENQKSSYPQSLCKQRLGLVSQNRFPNCDYLNWFRRIRMIGMRSVLISANH